VVDVDPDDLGADGVEHAQLAVLHLEVGDLLEDGVVFVLLVDDPLVSLFVDFTVALDDVLHGALLDLVADFESVPPVVAAAEDPEFVVVGAGADCEADPLLAHGDAVHHGQTHVELTPLVQLDVLEFDRVQLLEPVEAARHDDLLVPLLAHEKRLPLVQHLLQLLPFQRVDV